MSEQKLNDECNFDENEESDSDINYSISEYDISSIPNDFNVSTINNLLISHIIQIPSFQRNYVWDQKKASKLIESIIVGLPVPQIFLYEKEKNKFLVIDGQQRLMSIYYFIKEKFPKEEKRIELRKIFDEKGDISDEYLNNKNYFRDFKLKLNSKDDDTEKDYAKEKKSKFHGLTYEGLEVYKTSFDLRPIRCVIIKQNLPQDDSSMFEIFNRLNTGGVNVKPQEIRTSLYDSEFFQMINKLNLYPNWRILIHSPNPHLHMRDAEVILRVFALAYDQDKYKNSMVNFLNKFSKKAKKFDHEENEFLQKFFTKFIDKCIDINNNLFETTNKKFGISTFEAIFVATLKIALKNKKLEDIDKVTQEKVTEITSDNDFKDSIKFSSINKNHINKRIQIATNKLFD